MTPTELLDRIREAESETFLYYLDRIRGSLGIDMDEKSILNLAALMGLRGIMTTIEYKGEPAALDVFNHTMEVYIETILKTVAVKRDRMKRAADTLSDIIGRPEAAPEVPEPEPEPPAPVAEVPAPEPPAAPSPKPKTSGPRFNHLAEALRKAWLATGINRKQDEFPDCRFAVPPEDIDK